MRGARPVRDFLRSLSDDDYADVRAAMDDVGGRGLPAARHLRGDIYEVRSSGDQVAAARERRALIAQLAAKRRELTIPQAEVARRMTTSQAERNASISSVGDRRPGGDAGRSALVRGPSRS